MYDKTQTENKKVNIMKALLVLEDGRTFPCQSFTGEGEVFGEVVFNTSMTGYQEILTDPSYSGQFVTMTYPLVGNYGVNPFDVESDKIHVSAFIIKENQRFPNNFKSTKTLELYLKESGILAVDDLDTRALTRHIRSAGVMRAVISTKDLDAASLVKKVKKSREIAGLDLVSDVSTKKPYKWYNNRRNFCEKGIEDMGADIFDFRGKKKLVAAFDFGIKYNILRSLVKAGCEIVVVPASTDAETVKAMNPDGIFLSNGPGDPEPVFYAVETIRKLLGFKPIFGICLGNQLLGLALGGKTYKLKFGHRGANQPVKNLITGKVEITSQNHGFAIDLKSFDSKDIMITHMNLNDNTIEGFRHKKYSAFSVQYHPEASPGPHESEYHFYDFVKLMQQ